MIIKKTKSELTSLINIGKVIAYRMEKIGIVSVDDFMSKDPYKVFEKLLKEVDPALCRCALASIVGAHINAPWHKITKQTAVEFIKRHPNHKWPKC